MFKKYLLTIFIAATLSGCNYPSVDSSSTGAMDSSLTRLKSLLSNNDQAKFAKDVEFISRSIPQEQMLADLNGKNAQEVMFYADALRFSQISNRVQALEAKIKTFEEAQCLQPIK